MGIFFLDYAPGPDLAYQDAVMESEAFITSENSCISKSLRALRGVGSTSRRPGQACDMGPYWVVSKWFIEPSALES
jgi:hypothetical protein